jgi:hypothetical protein
MDLQSVFRIVLWSIFAVLMAYNVRALWRPLPRRFNEKSKLRKEAMQLVEASDLTDFEKDVGFMEIEGQQSLERLRLYARFANEFSVSTIDSLAGNLRINFTRLLTNMTPSRITRDHLAVYERFVLIRREIRFTPDSVDDVVNHQRKDLSRTAVYTMTHMDRAEEIVAIMTERGIYDLKQIKALLGQMKKVQASTLSEGAL